MCKLAIATENDSPLQKLKVEVVLVIRIRHQDLTGFTFSSQREKTAYEAYSYLTAVHCARGDFGLTAKL